MRINVLVTTNSKHSEIVSIDKSNYRIRIDAPAIEGKANKRLIEIMSKYFKVPKSSVKILKGLKSKNKIVEINL